MVSREKLFVSAHAREKVPSLQKFAYSNYVTYVIKPIMPKILHAC